MLWSYFDIHTERNIHRDSYTIVSKEKICIVVRQIICRKRNTSYLYVIGLSPNSKEISHLEVGLLAQHPLGLALKRRGLVLGTCSFYTISLEDNTHRFIKCPIACIIWISLSDVWQVFTHFYSRPQVCSKWSKWRGGDIVPIVTILGTTTQLKYA